MKGKVTCPSCGWSWNKSDSSKKDMHVCHNCGKSDVNMKNGGWLDNYNDSQASAPEGMIGDGFSNVGRNYSPAWGGQFQTGGKLLGTDLNIFDNMMGGHNNSQYETYGDDVASNLDTFNPHYVRINDSNTNINYGKGLDFTNQPNYEESDRRYMPWYNNQAMPFFKTRLEDNPYYRLNTPNGNINYNTSSNYSNSEPSIIDEKNISPSWNIKQRNTRLEGRGGTYDDINTTTDNMNVVEQAKRKAEAFNKSIEKKYGDSSNPKAQERARILRNDIEVTPNYQLGGNVYPVNYVPQAQDGTEATYSYPVREKLYPGEDEYFKANPHVGGMAAEDKHVIINPYSPLSDEEKNAIRINETARLAMRNGYKRPIFDLTPEQQEAFKNYSTNEQDQRETIIGRILSGDPSAKNVTPEQKKYAEELQKVLKFQGGGSIPGAVGFTYARTKGIPSNGPYAKKTKASAQNGVDMYGAPITANLIIDRSFGRSHYDPRTNTMTLGADINPENKDKVIAHENYHASQYADDMMNYDIAHHTDQEQWARMRKKPAMVSNDEVWLSYYDRKPREIDDLIDYDINSSKFLNSYANTVSQGSPSAAINIIPNTIYDKANVDSELYHIPRTSEGDAQHYEDTGLRNYQHGGEMRYYQHGLDWKPKTISRNGGWLDSYEEGGVIKDDRGQWDHPGEITEINSPYITMQGVPYDVLGISDTGDVQMMYPEEEYEFDGEKVTEIPMAQDGKKFDFSNGPAGNMKQSLITAINKDKKQTPNTKERKTTAVDKTSVKQNKQKKIVDVPLTEKEILYNSINNQARFMNDWMDSPMYNEMVDNSTTGYFDKQYLNSGRDFNFDNTKVQLHPQPEGSPNTGASSNNETGLIKLFPLGAKDDAVQGMLAHEISHSSDRPVRFKPNWLQQHHLQPVNKYNSKYTKKEIRLIPQKDINLMRSFYSDNSVYKNLFNQSALKDDELNEQREWFNYVSDPTETRARLNDIRYNAKINGIYDPFTQKVTPEILNEIKELTKKAGGFDPFNQLQGVYSDEEILKLLNTVSQNEQPNENPNVALAKNGIRQEQKGLVNLDNLTNFTNYNKPQPSGWLSKYE